MTSPREAAERAFATEVVQTLRQAGHEAYWAGGCVRDQLLGLTPKDYDVATSAHPTQVRRLFERTVAVGMSFGVIEVIRFLPGSEDKPLHIEVATFRIDEGYSDGRRPDRVKFCSAREDALRRDFTINGMFYDPLTEEVHDYVGGRQDLTNHVLRAIGDPVLRFQEDKLRLLRAVRMASRFNLEIDPDTETAIRAHAIEVGTCSAERIAEELRKMLVHPSRSRSMQMFVNLGLAAAVLPELLGLQKADLWEHVLTVLGLLEMPSVPLAFAALLHELIGARLADQICLRLKMSNDERERIVWLVEKHQALCDARQLRPSKLKTLLNHPCIRDLLALHRADARASHTSEDHVDYCEQLLREWTQTDLNPEPLITGYDLMQLGIPQGPQYKRLLAAVREAQLDGTIRTQTEAIELVQRILDRV